MKRTLMITAVAIGASVAGVFAAIELPTSFALSASAQAAASEQRAVFAIENMSCALCPITVKKAMEGVAGVKSVAIDFAAKTATVVFDAASTSIAKIAAASANAGYPANEIRS